MSVRIRCSMDGCGHSHVLEDGEYDVRDGVVGTSMYKARCPACRKKFDDMIAEMKRFDDIRERRDRLRERAEELVRDYMAPPAMVAAIIELVEGEVSRRATA